jgi:hypothetical protein
MPVLDPWMLSSILAICYRNWLHQRLGCYFHLKIQCAIKRGLDKNAFSVLWVWKWCGIVHVRVFLSCDVGGGGGGGGRMWPVLSSLADKCFWALCICFFLLGSAVFHLCVFVLLFALLLKGFIFLIA